MRGFVLFIFFPSTSIFASRALFTATRRIHTLSLKMYFRLSTVVALFSAPFLVLADNPNPFNIPSTGLSCTAGQACDLKWTPTTSGTISLVLRNGASNDLAKGVTIASHITNSGEFTWLPSANLPRGSDYTIEIIDDSDTSETNYTPYFVIESTNTLQSTTATSGATTGTTESTVTQTSGSTTVTAGKTTLTSASTTATTSGSSSGTGEFYCKPLRM